MASPRISRVLVVVLAAYACFVGPLRADEKLLEMEQQMYRLSEQGRYPEAEKIGMAMIEYSKHAGQPESLAISCMDLSTLYLNIERWHDAEPYVREALKIYEQKYGTDHLLTADVWNNLAEIYRRHERLSESEQVYRRVLAIREGFYGPRHEDVASSLGNLAIVLDEQGRFAEAEPLHQRALAIRRHVYGDMHRKVALSYYNLGHFYWNQHRGPEAYWCFEQSLSRLEKMTGGRHPDVYRRLVSLANLCTDMGRFAEAEKYFLRAEEVARQVVDPDHPWLNSQGGLAEVYVLTGRFDEADARFKKIIAYDERTYGPDSTTTALALGVQARLFVFQHRLPEALANWNRAIEIYERYDNNPHRLMICYLTRGEVHRAMGNGAAAIADMRRAVQFAEAKRANLAGGEQERAKEAAGLQRDVYRTAAAVYLESGLVADAFAAIEAGRSRALLEQMVSAHVDLLAGLAPAEAKQLRDDEEQARSRLALAENELDRFVSSKGAAEGANAELAKIQDQVAAARRHVVDAYAAIRTASPVYHRVLGKDFSPASLDRLQAYVADQQALVLYYSVGESSSWMIAVGGSDAAPRVYRFKLSDDQQRVLDTKEPELKLASLEKLLMNESDLGVLQLISNPKTSDQATEKLRALYDILVPASEQALIRDERIKRLIVIPDGPLALFPFEALVVEAGADPAYLIDVAPPINYAPSATILMNLADRKVEPVPAGREPVLALGDPAYGSPATQSTASRAPNFTTLGSRFAGLGGTLNRLPYSGQEAGWVAENYRKQGIGVSLLRQANATEGALRSQAVGHRILHLACHGLTDQAYGNFFGALALAPGQATTVNPADDGFLTLSETYELDLRCCELAILSACQTNYGPHQEGEGVWALTRGFLVAGSRRVIASNWLVDDAAAASLISYDCGILAKQELAGGTPDYALALRDAKRWVRSQPKWRSPYYWATFVIIGPN